MEPRYAFTPHEPSGRDADAVWGFLNTHISGEGADTDVDEIAEQLRDGCAEIWEIHEGDALRGVFLIREGIKRSKLGEGTFLECMGLQSQTGNVPGLAGELSAWLKAEYKRRGLRFLRIRGRVGWLKALKGEGYRMTGVQLDYGDPV